MIKEYVADCETTSVRVYRDVKLCGKTVKKLDQHQSVAFVCAWVMGGLYDERCDFARGRTVADLVNSAYTVAKKNRSERHKTVVFTHNLGFDGSFILYHCLQINSGIEIVNEVRDTSLYSFTAHFADGTEVTFRDSSKIFPMKAAALGELYGIKKLMGDWDYKKYRDENTPISETEWEYIYHDVEIIIAALRDYRSQGYMENTLAAIAYNDRLRKTYKSFNKKIANRMKTSNYEGFREAFPRDIKPLERMYHIYCLQAYFGGWTWLNPHYVNRKLSNLFSYDENSMYPDKMANAILPIGEPSIYLKPSEDEIKHIIATYPCIIWHFTHLTLELKNENSLPMLMFPTNPQTSVRCQGKVITCQDESVWLTNLDVEMMQQEYIIKDIFINGCICFAGARGQYKEFVDFWMRVKAKCTEDMNDCKRKMEKETDSDILKELYLRFLKASQLRDISKKMMNSSYGKDGTRLFRLKKTTILNDELLDYMREIEETTIEYYIPSAVFITASARYDLYSLLIEGREGCVYSDTDSAKVTEEANAKIEQAAEEGKIKIHDSELGAWKMEAVYKEAKFIRQKTYATYEKNKKGDWEWHYTVCGATDDCKKLMQIEEFKPGMEITLEDLHRAGLEGKLVPVAVKGGVILEETPFSIEEVDFWDEKGSKNMPIEMFVDYMRNLEKARKVG